MLRTVWSKGAFARAWLAHCVSFNDGLAADSKGDGQAAPGDAAAVVHSEPPSRNSLHAATRVNTHTRTRGCCGGVAISQQQSTLLVHRFNYTINHIKITTNQLY